MKSVAEERLSELQKNMIEMRRHSKARKGSHTHTRGATTLPTHTKRMHSTLLSSSLQYALCVCCCCRLKAAEEEARYKVVTEAQMANHPTFKQLQV